MVKAMKAPFDMEAASALSKGRRSCQEDALTIEFPTGAETGVVVLAEEVSPQMFRELQKALGAHCRDSRLSGSDR